MIQLLIELIFVIPPVRTLIFTVVPALALLLYVRSKDRLEPEPPKLIWTLFALGGVSVFAAWLVEAGGLYVLNGMSGLSETMYMVLCWFIVVGLVEEACKYTMLRLVSWKHPAFNCLFDGVVYAVAVSAGFALVENVIYLIRYGSSVVFIRAIVSVPAHICFSVFMGVFYSAAKKHERAGDVPHMRLCRLLAVLLATLAHGLYDLVASLSSQQTGMLLFGGYVIVLFIVCLRLVKRMAAADAFY